MKNEADENADSFVKWSKHPILGAPFFFDLAQRHVDQMLIPRKRTYSFADVIDTKTSKPRLFFMNDAAQDYFCGCFISLWQMKHGTHPLDYAHSDMILDYMDRQAQRLALEVIQRRKYVHAPKYDPVDDETGEVYPYSFNDTLNVYVAICSGVPMYWSYDEWGNLKWVERIRTPSEVAPTTLPGWKPAPRPGRREASVAPPSSERYRRASNGE